MALGLGMMLFVRIRRAKRAWRRVATFGGTIILVVGILYQPIVWGLRDVDLSVDQATIHVDLEDAGRVEIAVEGSTTQRLRVPAGYRIVLFVRSGFDRFSELSPALDVSPVWSWHGEAFLDPPYDPSEIYVVIARLLPEDDVGVESSTYRVESMPRLLLRTE